jgi:HD-like signal output (HDOD) protein
MTKEIEIFRAGDRKLNPNKIRILVRRVEHRSPMMVVVARVLEAIRGGCSPAQLSEIVACSPELSMKVLRLAASPAFSGRPVESIRHAVELLGWQHVANLVVTVGMRQQSDDVEESTRWDPFLYQRRCLATALVSRMLGRRIDEGLEDRYYLCGLFQEWGYLVLAQFAPEEYDRVAAVLARTPVESPLEVERFYLATDHAEIGGIAAEEYRLPTEVRDSIAFHHDPSMAPESSQAAADVAHVASWVAGEMGFQLIPGTTNHLLDRFSLMRLGWTVDDLVQIQQSILSATQNAAAALEDV